MRATYIGECSEGVEVDGQVVLPGGSCDFPDDAVLSSAVWKVDSKPAKPAKDGE